MKILVVASLLLAGHAASAVASSETNAELVKDLDTRRGIGNSSPMHFRRGGAEVYFNATTPATGRELYATDGTTARLVGDFAPGPKSSHASLVGLAGPRILVEADDGVQGQQVSAFDPVAGTTTALMSFGTTGDIGTRRARPLAQLAARTIFTVDTDRSVWGSDGTAAGTQRLPVGNYWDIAERVCTVGNRALFALSGGGGHVLWRSDGTSAGTTSVANFAAEWLVADTSQGGAHCYFLFRRDNGWSLWHSDGDTTNVLALQAAGLPMALAATPTGAYLAERDDDGHVRLWRSGAAAPFATLAYAGDPVHLHTVGERLVLRITVPENGVDRDAVYVSDGTAAGTHRLTMPASVLSTRGHFHGGTIGNAVVLAQDGSMLRIDPVAETIAHVARNPVLGYDGDFVAFGDAFVGPGIGVDGWGGVEVWRSDGTDAGTRELHDIWYTTRDTDGFHGAIVSTDRDVLFFTTVAETEPDFRYGVWRSDGSAAGTQSLPPAAIGNGSVVALRRFDNGVLVATERAGGGDVFRSDRQLASVTTLSSDRGPGLLATTDNGATALFSCGYAIFSRDLCAARSGGVATTVLEDAEALQFASPAGSIGDALLFQLGSPYATPAQRGLWRSDGTVPGTFQLTPDVVFIGTDWASAPHLSRDGKAYFGGYSIADAQHGLYVSDGTAAGTRRIAALPLQVRKIVPLGGARIAFTVSNGSTTQLWISDGTTMGTDLLRTFTNTYLDALAGVGERVHFVASDPFTPAYVVSDGTKGGTQSVALPPQWTPESGFIAALDADTAAFACQAPSFGVELCAIDADGANPRLVRDIFPGPGHSGPAYLGSTSAAVYFAAADGSHGRELWRVTARGDAIFADAFD